MSTHITRPLARVFSGIQPTGVPHLGNYFGALKQWVDISNGRELVHENNLLQCDIPIFSIVDVHAYASPSIQYGAKLYQSILDTTASLLAIGLSPTNCVLFRQSDLLEHNYLDNVLHNFVTTQRLSRMTQYKDKIATHRGTPNGLLNYPVLQAADILLYKASIVPIGEDQRQHIELTRDIARKFNKVTSTEFFVQPEPLFNSSEHARRIKSLREPEKKMSKSASNKNSFIEIVDEPDVLREKLKKALTDNISEVFFDANGRPGVSNLMRLHHLATGETIEQIQEQSANIESAEYKLRLADILIEYFKPIRSEFKKIRGENLYLEQVLNSGRDRSKPIAAQTVLQIKKVLGSID